MWFLYSNLNWSCTDTLRVCVCVCVCVCVIILTSDNTCYCSKEDSCYVIYFACLSFRLIDLICLMIPTWWPLLCQALCLNDAYFVRWIGNKLQQFHVPISLYNAPYVGPLRHTFLSGFTYVDGNHGSFVFFAWPSLWCKCNTPLD